MSSLYVDGWTSRCRYEVIKPVEMTSRWSMTLRGRRLLGSLVGIALLNNGAIGLFVSSC